MPVQKIRIKARTACLFKVKAGDRIRVTNLFGTQVVDTWAFRSENPSESMSMEHTRVHSTTPTPVVGTIFRTNQRRPILELTKDSSAGIHDWFYAACDQYRYQLLGHEGPHDNCSDNLRKALLEHGIELPSIPCPLNLFENVPLVSSGSMEILPPVGVPEDHVELLALIDALIVFSACPQDMVPTNGSDMKPKDVEIEIF